jgi:predicted N-acetyltransferase YhbS
MGVVIRQAVPADLERLLPLLDDEFVFGRGRRISLAQRFPAVYCAANSENIFLCEENGELLSAFAVKRFDWQDEGRISRGAMIGAVYTAPQRRGEGLASRLLKWGTEKLRQNGIDFAVLWTAQPAFYARLGWVAADCGLLGETTGNAGASASADGVTTMPAGDCARVEDIRRHWLASLTRRGAEDWRQLPLPADTVDLLIRGESVEAACYALVGHAGMTSILYEMVGHPAGFPALWMEARRNCQRILVNDSAASASRTWLAQDTDIDWQEKQLAMWLPLSERVEMPRLRQWYIPYFDRI